MKLSKEQLRRIIKEALLEAGGMRANWAHKRAKERNAAGAADAEPELSPEEKAEKEKERQERLAKFSHLYADDAAEDVKEEIKYGTSANLEEIIIKLSKQQLKKIIKEELNAALDQLVTVVTVKEVPRAGGGDVGWDKTTNKYPVGSKELEALKLNFPEAAGRIYKIDRDHRNNIVRTTRIGFATDDIEE